ncbi:swr complex subunit [Naganishia albida]|nr:swr complex subunit [Naganishia albida]
MPTAKDVRDILDIPAAPDAPPPTGNFNLKQPPPGRGVSFVTQSTQSTADAVPSVPSQSQPAQLVVGKGIAENLSAAERYRRSRGDGMVRELFSLIGDNAPSLAQWTEFNPANRPAGAASSLRLGHWRKIEPDTAIQKPQDPFAAFGKDENATSVVGYTQAEYEQWLQDDKWTADETNYLFSLLKEYDLRFLVVADRYAYLPKQARAGGLSQNRYAWPLALTGRKKSGNVVSRRSGRGTVGMGGEEGQDSRDGTPGVQSDGVVQTEDESVEALIMDEVKRRSMEEIKDRYYTICRRLIRNRPAKDEAAREKALKAYEYDIRKEIQRKRYADSLFHLSRDQIQEEEALFMEMKKIEQTERRYRAEREDLLRRVNGLDSGVLWPSAPGPSGNEGNRVFGNGANVGIGSQRARDGTVVGADKLKKRKRGDDGMETYQEQDQMTAQTDAPEDDPEFDRRNNIYRLPPSANTASSRSIHHPAFLRSTKLAQPKTTSQATTTKITTLLEELGVSASRLIMPTRENLERYEALLGACGMLVDIKRMVDRAEQEVRVLKMQKESGVVGTPVMGTMAPPPVPLHADAQGLVRTSSGLVEGNKRQKQRSASIVSSSASEAVSRRRK